MNISPSIIAAYTGLAWLLLAAPAALLIGRGIALADRATTTARRALAHSCPCGTCS